MKRSDIKIGNHVVLVDAAGIFTLEMYKSYEIADIEKNSKEDLFIRIEGDEQFYNSRRFKLDVKFQRKEKIKRINEENEKAEKDKISADNYTGSFYEFCKNKLSGKNIRRS